MTNAVITWSTTKTDGGFQFRVYSFGYQIPEVTLKVGVVQTRAQATLRARKWSSYFKAKRAPLTIAICTDIAALHALHTEAYGDHDTDTQIRVMARLKELGDIKPMPRGFYRRDADQLDTDEEADAHGITTSELLRR